jgi:D-glycero-D-manno-heptose 1,7-bisphosphate phosphatase
MLYIKEHGYVDSPTTPQQFKIINGVTKAIITAKKLGYKVIIISNQPGIAKGYYNKKIFDTITKKMHKTLQRSDAMIDDEFYCFHHPNAKLIKYRKKCSCRKPSIGLLKKAAKDHNLNLRDSFFIGDGLVDMEAAKKAGCKSIFVGNVNSMVTKLFDKKRIQPDYVAHNLLQAVNFIRNQTSEV